jgi:hypothetical protein
MRRPCQPLRPGAAAAFAVALLGVAAAQESTPKASGEIPELPPIEDLSATMERPLFMPSRRPPAPPPPAPVAKAEPVAVPTEESPADLTGIVKSPDRTYAILTSRATKEVHHLRMGEKIEEWSVQEIGARYVVLRRGPGSLRLDLFAEKEAAAAGADDGERSLGRTPPTLRPRFTPRPRQARQPQRAQRPPRRPRRGDQD